MGRLRGVRYVAARDEGFSIVEVLVVVTIISLLASISIPIFFHQREKAWQAATESALKNASTAMNSAAITRGGSYVGLNIPLLVAEEGLKYEQTSIDLLVASANQANYCLSAEHNSWQRTMYWDSADSVPDFEDCTSKY